MNQVHEEETVGEIVILCEVEGRNKSQAKKEFWKPAISQSLGVQESNCKLWLHVFITKPLIIWTIKDTCRTFPMINTIF